MEDKHNFELSADEWEYLHRLAADDDILANQLRNHRTAHGPLDPIVLSRSEAEILRDRLTIHLALVGFDEYYSLNDQGQIIEKLIDKFYIC